MQNLLMCMPTCTISFLFPDAVEYSVHSPTGHLKPIDEKDIAVLFTHCAGEGANAGKGSGTEGVFRFFSLYILQYCILSLF